MKKFLLTVIVAFCAVLYVRAQDTVILPGDVYAQDADGGREGVSFATVSWVASGQDTG